MKHHFVATENQRRLLSAISTMENRGSATASLCLVHGDPGVGKTRNVDNWAAPHGAVLIKGHVGMNLDGLQWAISNSLGVKHVPNRTRILDLQVPALRGIPIIFDEAQYGLKMRQGETRAAGIEYLRDIAERAGTYVILVCHNSEIAGFSESAHIRTRIAMRMELKNATQDDTGAFVRSLAEVAVDDDVVKTVHDQTKGKFRLIEGAIVSLEAIARLRKLDKLTLADIGNAPLVVDHEQGLIPKVATKRVGAR